MWENWLRFRPRAARRWLGGASRGRCSVILIDGENIAPSSAEPVMQFATTLGHVRHAEVFANFASPSSAGWATQMRAHGIVGSQSYAATPGKNAADIALTIRAMDVLHRERIDDFVLVSDDADFTALAHRIRRSGSRVHRVGSSTPRALRESCTTFRTLADLRGGNPEPHSRAPWSLQPEDAEDVLLSALGSTLRWTAAGRCIVAGRRAETHITFLRSSTILSPDAHRPVRRSRQRRRRPHTSSTSSAHCAAGSRTG
jgi:hypothetical protein